MPTDTLNLIDCEASPHALSLIRQLIAIALSTHQPNHSPVDTTIKLSLLPADELMLLDEQMDRAIKNNP